MSGPDLTRRGLLGAAGVLAGSYLLGTASPAFAGTTAVVPPDGSLSLSRYLATAGSSATITGQYYLDSPVAVPNTLRQLELTSTAKLIVRGNHQALTRRGTIVYRERLGASVAAGATSFTALNSALYTVGEYVLLSGENVVSGSTDRYGYIRKVLAKNGTTIQIDAAVPRTIDVKPRTSKITFAPSLKIVGAGEIYNANSTDGLSPLIDFFATDSPQVSGIRVHHNGTSGILVMHCLSGVMDCQVSDLLDDSVTYFGYGVNVAGATRGLAVRGTMTRVRHAVTTNPSSVITDVGSAGEPEDCFFAPTAVDCSDKGIDTHRLGWNTQIVPNVVGGRGGVQIRADNTHVTGGTIVGTAGPGVSVTSVVAVAATITGVAITGLKASGNAILCAGPSSVSDITIRDCYGDNIVLGNHCVVSGGSISAGSPVGVSFLGSNNSVTGIQLGDSVTIPYKEAAGVTNNVFTTTPPVDIDLLPAPVSLALPVITGGMKLGTTLSVSPGIWNMGGISYTYSWLRNGVPITGAVERNFPRYDIVLADIGQRISASVIVRRAGYGVGTSTSQQTTPIQPAGPLANVTRPSISGSPAVGSYVTVDMGTWSPAAQRYAVAWQFDGVALAGASSKTYRVRTVDVGKKITATVTAGKDGWLSGQAQSAAITAG